MTVLEEKRNVAPSNQALNVTDKIYIRDLLLRTIIGIHDWERDNKQDLIINVTLDVDMRAAGQSDDIDDAVNYRSITKRIIDLVEASSYGLLEKLGTHLCDTVLNEYPGVGQIELTLDKPAALRFARSVAVSMTRARNV
ncbi:dihydroneopterin aldolase [bacterium]|jgi:D-erythro-7,8-dihydroneopterin triphosphate epimerase|nr:dihydroneopterin aldolase [bacterium]